MRLGQDKRRSLNFLCISNNERLGQDKRRSLNLLCISNNHNVLHECTPRQSSVTQSETVRRNGREISGNQKLGVAKSLQQM